MENWEKAIRLHTFIRYHTPKGYREAIHNFDFVPSVTEDEYTTLEKAYQDGWLLTLLSNHINLAFRKPYITSAIQAYFNQTTLHNIK
jgi:hypothetical protein